MNRAATARSKRVQAARHELRCAECRVTWRSWWQRLTGDPRGMSPGQHFRPDPEAYLRGFRDGTNAYIKNTSIRPKGPTVAEHTAEKDAGREADLLIEVGHPSRPDREALMREHIARIKERVWDKAHIGTPTPTASFRPGGPMPSGAEKDALVEQVAEALRTSRLCYGTHADRWIDQEWQRGFWTEVATVALVAANVIPSVKTEGGHMNAHSETRSVYVLGGNGTGKSTFTAKLLAELGWQLGPLEDLHTVPNARGSLVTLRGHRARDGLYLGCMRDEFPGTDGLDRASSIAAASWLAGDGLPARILGEGATLTTTRFLTALRDRTDLLLVHLWCSDDERERRFAERGSAQDPQFAKVSAGRAAKAVERIGGAVLSVDSADPTAWDLALDIAAYRLRGA